MGDPNNEGVGWDGREGGWQGVSVIDTFSLINDELYDELEMDIEQLKEDILNSLSDQEWCRLDPYGLRLFEENLSTWDRFCEQIMYETRYVFFRNEDEVYKFGSIYAQPYDILETIGEAIKDLDLIRIEPGTYQFYRGRTHDDPSGFTKAEDLGPPRREKALQPNRMSPAGIPMFYGATDEQTAIEEIRDDKDFVTIGMFENTQKLNLIDLSSKIPFPSLFDEEKRSLRNDVIFIRQFVRDLSKPLSKDLKEHIDYVPTQIVTEYFRRVYRFENVERIDGILYPSSKKLVEYAAFYSFKIRTSLRIWRNLKNL